MASSCGFSRKRRALFALALAALASRVGAAGGPARVVFFYYGAFFARSPRTEWIEGRRAALRAQFANHGHIDGGNLALGIVTAGADDTAIERTARSVVAGKPAVICVPGTYGARLFKTLTPRIPIVFFAVGDAVAGGLVESLRAPGGNVTGVSHRSVDMIGKRLQLLLELASTSRTVAAVRGQALPVRDAAREAAAKAGLRLIEVEDPREEQIVQILERERPDVVLYFLDEPTVALLQFLVRARIPAAFGQVENAMAGGLLSYGPRPLEQELAAVDIAARILEGKAPSSIPVEQLLRPHFVLNLRTARAMELSVPGPVRLQADQLLE